MKEMGLTINVVKAGHANMFLSPLFANAFSTLTNTTIQLYNTDGACGAALGAGIGAGVYKSTKEAFTHLKIIKTIRPNASEKSAYQEAYSRWEQILRQHLV
jgi:xylulokinase